MAIITTAVSITPIYRLENIPWGVRFLRWSLRQKKRLWNRRLHRRFSRLFFVKAKNFFARQKMTLALESGQRAVMPANRDYFNFLYLPPWCDEAGCFFELEYVRLLQKLAGRNGVFYDIGANWGYFGHALAGQKDFSGQVHFFEPHPKTHADLREIGRQFGLQNKEFYHAFALGAREEKLYLATSHHYEAGRAFVCREKTTLAIDVKTLDSLSLPPPAAMKLDVEGYEENALRGAEKLLRQHKPYIILENMIDRPDLSHGPLQFLEGLGYQLFLPCWQISFKGQDFYTTDINLGIHQPAKLALVPTAAATRALTNPLVSNLFACHQSRLEEMKTVLA